MRNAVARVRAAEPDTAIIVGYEDQAQNDWQSLFKLVQGTSRAARQYYEPDGNVYAVAVGTSFYGCFAPESIDLSFSATAFPGSRRARRTFPTRSTRPAPRTRRRRPAGRARAQGLDAHPPRSGPRSSSPAASPSSRTSRPTRPGRSWGARRASSACTRTSPTSGSRSGAEVHALTNFPNGPRALDACRAPSAVRSSAWRSGPSRPTSCPALTTSGSAARRRTRAAGPSLCGYQTGATPSSRCRSRSCAC